jgi:hypothetical protein
MGRYPTMIVRLAVASLTATALWAPISTAWARVPPKIEAGLRKIGPIVDPGCTAKLYRPLMPAKDITSGDPNPYPGVRVLRDQSFGPDPKDVVDLFIGDRGRASRDVLIYVPGGGGDKIEIQNKESNAFYDNIGRWAAKQGMVGVTMQRHASTSWDGGAKDVAAMIQWVKANVSKYKGNPQRIFIWAHSAGNVPVGTYLGRPELYGPDGVGVKGAILMSAGGFNILPARAAASPGGTRSPLTGAGQACGETGGIASTAGALPGRAAGEPGGPPVAGGRGAGGPPGGGRIGGGPPGGGRPGGGPPGGPQADPAIELSRSALPGLARSGVKILLANAEMDLGADPNVNGGLMPFNKALSDALCAVGAEHCPSLFVAKGHSHMSIVFSIDTADKSVSDKVLAFIRKTD